MAFGVSPPTDNNQQYFVTSRDTPPIFIGGAENARRQAKKRKRETPQRNHRVLSKKLSSFERFFGSLLSIPPQSFKDLDNHDIWSEVCARLGVPVPKASLPATYENKHTHFQHRAALVMEESRHILHESIDHNVRDKMIMELGSVNHTKFVAEHVILTMKPRRPFTESQLVSIRPGGVFLCFHEQSNNKIWGVVSSSMRGDDFSTDQSLNLLVFNGSEALLIGTEWRVTPVASLISEFRCFEAMTNKPSSIGFLDELMGKKKRAHIRFQEDEGDKSDSSKQQITQSKAIIPEESSQKRSRDQRIQDSINRRFHVPKLNGTQERAAHAFVESHGHTISLVQGPPGTGKTTLLVATICQLLGRGRRLIVCAPTNKAVAVLARRFLASCRNVADVRTILVGDQKKLLADEQSYFGGLESIFLYKWLENVIQDYKKLRVLIQAERQDDDMRRFGSSVCTKLRRGLCYLESKIVTLVNRIDEALSNECTANSTSETVAIIDLLISSLKELSDDECWTQLLVSADIIFCTLVTAGNSILRRAGRVDDLIVDEAAAATEPEICIPFHLRPSRLLAVGDPMQLPATVSSPRATSLGLAKSLHERLMYDCEADFVMLDVQYRMHPAISNFPSSFFYESKILNGSNVMEYSVDKNLYNNHSYVFLDVKGEEERCITGSYRNDTEAQAIVNHVLRLRQQNKQWYTSDKLRIITFYQAQVALIQRRLQQAGIREKILVATVDSSQGSEADTILISFVRCKTNAGFLTDDRRLNVALTRAKTQLICIGSLGDMTAKTLRALHTHAVTGNYLRVMGDCL